MFGHVFICYSRASTDGQDTQSTPYFPAHQTTWVFGTAWFYGKRLHKRLFSLKNKFARDDHFLKDSILCSSKDGLIHKVCGLLDQI